MSISSVGSTTTANQVSATGGRSALRQARQDFEQMFQALQSGDLSSAQKAYNDLQQLRAGAAGTTTADSSGTAATSTTAVASTANPVAADWSSLGQALNSGSLSSAQDALTKLKQDAVAQWQAKIQDAQASYALLAGTPGGGASTTTPTGSGGNAVQTDLSNLQSALQSGDTAGAKQVLAQLQQDLLSSGQAALHRHGHRHDGFANMYPAAAYTAGAASAGSATSAGTNTGGIIAVG